MIFEFYQIVIAAIVIMFIPIVKIPFKMLSVYFHELGHGIMAILTGGGIDKIVLNANGSGVCHFRYRNELFHFFIALAGYLTTSGVGYYIYYTSRVNSEMITIENLYVILGAIFVSILLWVRDAKTFFLVLVMAMLFAIPVADHFLEQIDVTQYTVSYMQLIGVFIMLDGLISPLHLIDGGDDGDGGDLESMTRIPEGFWIALWLGVAAFALYSAYTLG